MGSTLATTGVPNGSSLQVNGEWFSSRLNKIKHWSDIFESFIQN